MIEKIFKMVSYKKAFTIKDFRSVNKVFLWTLSTPANFFKKKFDKKLYWKN